uniref:TLDc domain-containing protein n=1 Tax=Mesocestoides corti TaxID=53468 RepID=A0A5K3EYJ5_MESCO
MTGIPFTDLVDEEYVASFASAGSFDGPTSLDEFAQKHFSASKPLKNSIRKLNLPVNHPVRRQLWPYLLSRCYGTSLKIPTNENAATQSDNGAPAPSPIQQSLLVGYELADRRLQSTYHLNSRGKAIHLSLLHEVSVARPQIVYAPQSWPILALLLHYLRPREALACLNALLDQSGMISQSKGEWRGRCLALEQLGAAGFPKKKLFMRLPHNEAARNQLAVWPVAIWDFPFECLVPILDCYLVEGTKVLFRVGLVLWNLAMKATPEKTLDAVDVGALLKSAASNYPPTNASGLLKKAFRIRGLSRRHITSAVDKAMNFCQVPNAGLELVDSLVVPCVLPGQRTYTAYSQVKAEFAAKGEIARASLRSAKATATASSLATSDEILALIGAIKDENLAQLCTPTVIFSSEHDGVSLQTLFGHCAAHARATGHPETIILIRTGSGAGLVGAYCSKLWAAGSEWSFYGNGDSFLFRLRPSPAVFYKWDREAGVEKFQRATNTFIEVGGGLDSGPAGLRLDANLEQGDSGCSPTFASDCLITADEDRIQVGNVNGKVFCSFKISAVEVMGFMPVPT